SIREDGFVDRGRNFGCVHAGKCNRGTSGCCGDDMTIDPRTRIGHVHLTVSDLDRALQFYRDVLGFEVTARYGADAVFVSAGGYHHHIGLNTWAGRGAPRPPAWTTGLYHFAILYPDRPALAAAVRRVLEPRIPLEGASDHGVSEAVSVRDPDRTAVELYWARPDSAA